MDLETLLNDLVKYKTKKSPIIHLEIPLKLRPKARPRRVEKHFKVWWYTPSSKNEEDIGFYAAKIMREKGWEKLARKIRLSGIVYLKSKAKEDISNLLKAIEDALEGVCYYNDIQIREYGEFKVVNEANRDFIIINLEEIEKFKKGGKN